MRRTLVLTHRWLGLISACFLFIAGLTGAVIAWDHELDAWLNPAFFRADDAKPALSPLELAARLEATDARLRVTYLPLAVRSGEALTLMVSPRDSEAKLGFNQVS